MAQYKFLLFFLRERERESGSCSGLLVELVPFFQVSSRTFSSRVFNALSLCLLKREKNSGAWAAALSPFITDGKKEETVRMRMTLEVEDLNCTFSEQKISEGFIGLKDSWLGNWWPKLWYAFFTSH